MLALSSRQYSNVFAWITLPMCFVAVGCLGTRGSRGQGRRFGGQRN